MHRLFLAAFLVLGAAPALASGRNPQLPSSGIVIHLFGPDAGIPERATPAPATPPAGAQAGGTVAGATVAGAARAAPAPAAPKPAVSASASPAVANPAPASVAPATVAPAASTKTPYPEPQLGTILHQMFVTGDPNRGTGFSTGRPKAY